MAKIILSKRNCIDQKVRKKGKIRIVWKHPNDASEIEIQKKLEKIYNILFSEVYKNMQKLKK